MTKQKRPDKETLERLYHTERLSTYTIGELYGVRASSVRQWMIKMDILRRDYSENVTPVPKGSRMPKAHRKAISEAQKKLVRDGKRLYGGENNPSWKGGKIDFPCSWCGAPVSLFPGYAEAHEHHFCKGTDCHSKWMSKHAQERRYDKPHYGSKVVSCDSCGKEFRRRNARIKRSPQNFCSPACKKEWYRGENTTVWKGGYDPYYGKNWLVQRRKARTRDGHTCQHCGKHRSELDRALDVHHIVSFSDFGIERYEEANRLDNLITLCPSCHSKITGAANGQASS